MSLPLICSDAAPCLLLNYSKYLSIFIKILFLNAFLDRGDSYIQTASQYNFFFPFLFNPLLL